MTNTEYLKMLVEEFHSTTMATIAADGHPQTRVIDLMLWDAEGVYFLTAKGKAFYDQLMKQMYVALSATKDQKAISLRGKIRNIGSEKLDEIFEKNTYMKGIYPGDTRKALEVFRLFEAEGEYFDISDPSKVIRASVTIGNPKVQQNGFRIGTDCDGCKMCISVCPQSCIDVSVVPAVIHQNQCLHCGNCVTICPKQSIQKIE